MIPRRALLVAALAGCEARLAGVETPPGSPLQVLGGIEIPTLGGLSGLHIDDAGMLAAVSDTARWLRARLVLAEDGRPLGLADVHTGPLRDGAGRPLTRGHQGDAESLLRLSDGRWLVGFERWHRIRVFDGLDGPGHPFPAPPGLEEAPRNGGLESLALLADGRLLAIAEARSPGGDCPTWIGTASGAWEARAYRPAPGMLPTDACGLADGGALVVERGFTYLGGFWGRLVRLTAAEVAAPVLAGTAVLALEPPLPVDNWEAVARFTHRGRPLVALLSDDNESLLQRSMLLVFAWR